MDVKEFKIKTKDGMFLSGRVSLQPAVKDVIILNHGFGEHIRRYDHVFHHFVNKGYSVLGYDMRGHGISDGRRGHMRKYEDLLDDLNKVVDYTRYTFSPDNTILYGHSTGGALVLNYLLGEESENVEYAITTGPWLELYKNPPLLPLAKIMTKIIPTFSSNPKIDPDELMENEYFKNIYKKDDLILNTMSSAYLVEAINWGKKAMNEIQKLDTPTLLMHGSKDRITKFDSSKYIHEKNSHYIDFKEWALKHELHNEENWEEVLEYVDEWIQKKKSKSM